jgi:putative DNA primase/helicase
MITATTSLFDSNHDVSVHSILRDKLASFPAGLKALPRWVTWKYETRDGKATKIPYNPITHRRASSTDPSTWSDWATAIGASSMHGYAGVGCMIASPYAAIDLDKCRDNTTGIVEPWAAAVVGELNSYTELSPSGRGFHIWIKGTVPPDGNRKGRVEMYNNGRYFTVTGDHFPGSPLTVEERDLTSLHARMLAGTLEVIPAAPTPAVVRGEKPSRDDLIAGRWQGYYDTQSQADFALCGLLAEEFGGDAAKIDVVFRASGLFRAKWDERRGVKTYGERTIDGALELWRGKGAICVVEEGPEEPVSTIPIYPAEALDGDHIGELTRILTDGTPIPPQFVRENTKCILGAVIDGHVGFPGQERLHTKLWTVNISVHSRTGKGESWNLTGNEDTGGVLLGLLAKYGVKVIDGGLFGSGEIMAKLLCDLEREHSPSHVLARFDEMSEPFEKSKVTGSTWHSKLLQLYERTAIASGSFKNGEHQVKDTRLSLSGDFTRAGFQTTFEGSGSRGSGFLPRCTLSYSDRIPHTGDWARTDMIAASRVLTDLECCADTLTNLKVRLVPEASDEANGLRWEFIDFLRKGDPRYTPELEAHFKRDLLMRALFSGDTQIDALRTRKSIAWTLHQLELRNELWPEDAGGPVERMERAVLKTLAKGSLTLTRLIDYCNVNRPGSGGHEVFNRALRALVYTHSVKVVGKSQRGTLVYALEG